MKAVFLQAQHKDGKAILWCKLNGEYVQVIIDAPKTAFVRMNDQQITEVKIQGTPDFRIWGTQRVDGHVVKMDDIPDDLLTALKDKKMIFEHDIDYARQFTMQHNLTTGKVIELEGEHTGKSIHAKKIEVTDEYVEELEVLSFDIETYCPDYIIAPERYPILMIGFSNGTESIVFSHSKTTKHDFVVMCDDEKDMIIKSLKYIEDKRPDIIVGYNSDSFDFWYILRRCRALGLEPTLNGHIIANAKRHVDMPGPVHIDLYPFCRNALRTTLKTNTFSLDAVAQEVLDKQKDDSDLSLLPQAWDNDNLEEYFAYNKVDVDITHALFSALWSNMRSFQDLISIDLASITRMGFAMLVEHFLMTRAIEQKSLIPALPSVQELEARHAFTNIGAYVHQPRPGIYERIVVADFSSLYPSIIVSHNLDPAVAEDDAIGFIPRTLNDLITARNIVKKQLKENPQIILEARSQNLKILANAMYGYLSFAQSRWYSSQVASKITQYGRDYIKEMIQKTNDAGYTILYSDTDSLFFCADNVANVKEHIAKLNEGLPGIMHLDLDEIYKRGLFVSTRGGQGAKKKYAMLRDDDTLKIVGFEAIRHDWSKLAKDTQRTLLEMTLRQESTGTIASYMQSLIDRMRAHRFTLEEVTLWNKIRKDLAAYKSKGPAVIAAERMIKRGIKTQTGMSVAYIVTTGDGPLREKVRLPDEIDVAQVDVEYYIENQIKPVTESILDLVDLRFPTRQKDLKDFF